MPFFSLPNELIVLTARELTLKDVSRLLRTNHHLANLLKPELHQRAVLNRCCDRALFCAAATGNEALTRILLAKGDQMTIKNRTGTVLHRCPGEYNDGVVQAVLAEGANIVIGYRHREQSSLHLACRRSSNSLLRLFLECGADPALRDGSGCAPLDLVKNVEAARFLIQYGADPVDVVPKRHSRAAPLEIAVQQGRYDVVEVMLEVIDVKYRNKSGKTPLHMAAEFDNEVLTKSILDKGADIAAQDDRNDTPLHFAVLHKNPALVKLLLERGADPTSKGRLGQPAILVASRRPYNPVYRLLIEYTNIEYQAKQKRTLLHLAIEPTNISQPPPPSAPEKEDIELVRYLLDKGININAQDEHGKTALAICTQYGCKVLVNLLLSKGADPNIRDHNETSALHIAVQPWSQALVGSLLENGADLHAQDADGRTVVHLAAMKDEDTVLQLFLKKGADINIRDKRGQTALHLAVMYGGKKVMKVLLDMGADREAKDYIGWKIPEAVLKTDLFWYGENQLRVPESTLKDH